VQEGLRILGAKVRPRLGFLEIVVRGIVFKHNLFILISFLLLFKSAYLNK